MLRIYVSIYITSLCTSLDNMATTMPTADVVDRMNGDRKAEKELGLNSLFFDKVGLYLSLLAVVLIGIDTAANLLPGGSDLMCFIPSNVSASQSQTDFVNAYCDNQLPSTKFSGFTVFLQSFITTALYFLWDAFKNYYVHKYAETERKDDKSDSKCCSCCWNTCSPILSYTLILFYYIKHLSQLAVVITGVIAMLWELNWMPFTFDKTFLCNINFEHTWSLSSVQCDYTSVALSPIFLAIYLTISVCILLAGIFALISIHLRMTSCCICGIDNNRFMRLIAVGDTAERAYKKLQE